MTDIGKRGLSPNPVQRFLVDRPGFTPLVGATYFVVPSSLILASNGKLWLQLFVGCFGLLTLKFWFSDVRKMDRDERWHSEAIWWPWSERLPGWRNPQDAEKE